MTKTQIKLYHLLLEAVELRENDPLAKHVHAQPSTIFDKEVLEQKDFIFAENRAIYKRLNEIQAILINELELSEKNAHNLVYDRTREELPKHMLLPDGNYFKIEYQGIVYENTPAQAIFIENVYQLFLDGQKTFNAPDIFRNNNNIGYDNISELFKGNPIKGTLIKKEKKATYRLDIKI